MSTVSITAHGVHKTSPQWHKSIALTPFDTAKANPDTHVIGTDLSKIQPESHPANCEFIKEDSEEEWLYAHKFDYVHLRFVFTCFQDPKVVVAHAYDNLNPGGWIEYQ